MWGESCWRLIIWLRRKLIDPPCFGQCRFPTSRGGKAPALKLAAPQPSLYQSACGNKLSYLFCWGFSPRPPWKGSWSCSKSPNPLHHTARQPETPQQTAWGWAPLPPLSCLQIPIILWAITGASPVAQYPISPRGHCNICRAGLHGRREQNQPCSSY